MFRRAPSDDQPAPRHPVYTYFLAGSALFSACVLTAYYSHAKPPFDWLHYLIGRDFVNMWMGARAALSGTPEVLFEMHRYCALLQQTFSPSLPLHNWSYPPHILLLIWPFGFFPYLAGYLLWLVVGLGLMLWVSGRKDSFLFLILAPVTLLNILTGQNGFFTAALLIGALANWDRRPALSGMLFGLLTVKPQIILLVPLVLVLTRRWRVLAMTAAMAMLMAILTTLIWGPDVWRDYLRFAVPIQNQIMTEAPVMMQLMMPTPLMNMRLLGLPLSAAWAVQAAVSLAVLAAVIWTYRRPRDPLLSAAMLLASSLVFSPYAFNYDMVALTVVLARLRDRADNGAIDTILILTLWILPVAMMLAGFYTRAAPSTILLLMFMNRLYQRMKTDESAVARPVLNTA
jgi:hypothetical protein